MLISNEYWHFLSGVDFLSFFISSHLIYYQEEETWDWWGQDGDLGSTTLPALAVLIPWHAGAFHPMSTTILWTNCLACIGAIETGTLENPSCNTCFVNEYMFCEWSEEFEYMEGASIRPSLYVFIPDPDGWLDRWMDASLWTCIQHTDIYVCVYLQ